MIERRLIGPAVAVVALFASGVALLVAFVLTAPDVPEQTMPLTYATPVERATPFVRVPPITSSPAAFVPAERRGSLAISHRRILQEWTIIEPHPMFAGEH
jgi:hypothetical protein